MFFELVFLGLFERASGVGRVLIGSLGYRACALEGVRPTARERRAGCAESAGARDEPLAARGEGGRRPATELQDWQQAAA